MQRICNINFDRQNFKDFHLNGGFYASIAIFNNYIHSVAFKNMLVISSLKPKNQMALTIMCPRWFEQFLGRLLNNQIMINCYFIKTLAVPWSSSFPCPPGKTWFLLWPCQESNLAALSKITVDWSGIVCILLHRPKKLTLVTINHSPVATHWISPS